MKRILKAGEARAILKNVGVESLCITATAHGEKIIEYHANSQAVVLESGLVMSLSNDSDVEIYVNIEHLAQLVARIGHIINEVAIADTKCLYTIGASAQYLTHK